MSNPTEPEKEEEKDKVIWNFTGPDLKVTPLVVHVEFLYGDLRHTRDVTAAVLPDGAYDEEGTKVRVAAVAAGIPHKFDAGAIQHE